MKILFVTVAPIGGAADSGVYTDLLREFRDRDCEVYVVCPAEPGGRWQPGFTSEDGIGVLRVRTGGVTKVRSMLQRGVSTVLMEYRFIAGIRRYFSKVRFDLVICVAPPVNLDLVVRFVKSRDSCSSYLLLKDIFPQNAVDLGFMRPSGAVWRYFRARERRLYRVCDHIGCMSKANVEYLLKHNPELAAGKVEVCPNAIKPIPFPFAQPDMDYRRSWGVPPDSLLLVYGGNLGVAQGVDFLLEVVDACRDRAELFFAIVGSGTEYARIRGYLDSMGISNARLLPELPRREYTELLLESDIGLVFLDARFTIPNVPSRLTAYLEAAVPIVAATDGHTDVPRILEDARCGYGVATGDLGSFMGAIERLWAMGSAQRREMGLQGRRLLEREYTVSRDYEIIMSHQRHALRVLPDGGYFVRDMVPADVGAVVGLHVAAMPDFFLTSLGPAFLGCYYRLLVVADSALATVATGSRGEIVGFAVGSTNPAGFYGRLLRRHWWRFALSAFSAVVRRPSSASRVLRALSYPNQQPSGESLAGLYSIAVDPRLQNHGIGRTLIQAMSCAARERGCAAMYLHADARGNDGWNSLLRRTGWRLERTFTTPEGREMNEYWIDLQEEEL